MKRVLIITLVALSFSALASGWDKDKGLNEIGLTGEVVCIGCGLKKMNGANAQCSLYAEHALDIKTSDGQLWSIVDNAVGHDLIRTHGLLDHKNITLKGFIYPAANMLEVLSYKVSGINKKKIQKKAWETDQMIAKALTSRKIGEVPIVNHKGHNRK